MQGGSEQPDQCEKVHAGNKILLRCDFETRVLQWFVNGNKTGPDVVVGGDGPIYPCVCFYGSSVVRIGSSSVDGAWPPPSWLPSSFVSSLLVLYPLCR